MVLRSAQLKLTTFEEEKSNILFNTYQTSLGAC